ncbi:ankyrin repeat domain-containing protein [Actinopolymorpha sp. B17G11]|uniref:ankyrin repeat domain-containing protein n=1 Tax=Actinopolymorpha sp. B17G11 TaxID=3160861 RepID=UPI0032E4CFD0
MPTISLPPNPSLDHLRHQARALREAVRAGDPSAAERVERQHPGGVPDDPAAFTLSTAQLAVAREYGFASWPRLKHYLDVVAAHGWDSTQPVDRAANSSPDPAPNSASDAASDTGSDPRSDPRSDPAAGGGGEAAETADLADLGDQGLDALADEFCRLACLTHSADDPARWDRARQLLAAHPDLPYRHIWAAVTAADVQTVRRMLGDDPTLARQRGGPYGWRPLFHLAYARVDPHIAHDAVLGIARALLAVGADPNEGYLWNGRPYAFTLLTGLFGEGELGPETQPRHPHAHALARLLLEAGADPNDSQTLYNRQFRPDDDHLELLFSYGLGTGDGGPWRARLDDVFDTPAALLRGQLRWAINHGFLERVRLLTEHGVDVRTPYDDGRAPVELAQLDGNGAIVDYLVAQGIPTPDLDPASALIAAVFAADRAAVERLRADHPGVVEELRRNRPGLIVWAAANGRTDTVTLLIDLGFDVNARGRGDVPVEQPNQTALHDAAIQGNVELARLLLARGADPNLRDASFNATPLGWARHGNQEAAIALLAPLTTDEDVHDPGDPHADADD